MSSPLLSAKLKTHDDMSSATNFKDNLKSFTTILMKPSQDRTNIELKRLESFLGRFELFQEFWKEIPEKVRPTFLREFNYISFEARDPIFRLGGSSKEFYLLLQGSAYALVPKTSEDSPYLRPSQLKVANKDSWITKSRRNNVILRSTTTLRSVNKVDSPMKKRSITQQLTLPDVRRMHPSYKVSNELDEGDMFGEIVSSKYTAKSVMMLAKESCHLLVLNNMTFKTIIRDYEERLKEENLEFIHKFTLLKNQPHDDLLSLLNETKTLTLSRNHAVYDFGDNSNFIYLIKSGEIEITKQARKSIENEQIFCRDNMQKHTVELDRARLLELNQIWKKRFSCAKKQQIRVALLGPYQSFGEEETEIQGSVRHSRATVKSATAEILEVPLERFMKNVDHTNKKVMHLERNKTRENWRKGFERKVKGTSLTNLIKPIALPSRQEVSEKLGESDCAKPVHLFGSNSPQTTPRSRHIRSTSHDPSSGGRTISKTVIDFDKTKLSLAKKFESVLARQAADEKDDSRHTNRMKISSVEPSPRSTVKTPRSSPKIDGMTRLWKSSVQSYNRRIFRDDKKPLRMESRASNKANCTPSTLDECDSVKLGDNILTCTQTKRWPRIVSRRQSIEEISRPGSIENTPKHSFILSKSKVSLDGAASNTKGNKEDLYDRLVTKKMSNDDLRRIFYRSAQKSSHNGVKSSNDLSMGVQSCKNINNPWININASPAASMISFFDMKNSSSSIDDKTPKSTEEINSMMTSQTIKLNMSSSIMIKSNKNEYKRSNFCDLMKDATEIPSMKLKPNQRALSVVGIKQF